MPRHAARFAHPAAHTAAHAAARSATCRATHPLVLPDTPTAAPLSPPGVRALALAAALLLALPALQAQTVPAQLPGAAEPGRPAPPLLLPTPGLGAPGISLPPSAAAVAPAGAEQLRFTLTRLQIDGASAYGEPELSPLYADLLGREISVTQAFGVAQAIELRYRNAGYVTSRVLVPQQTVEGGVFRIQVIEGFVSAIEYEPSDDIGPAQAAVQRLLAPLRGVRPISIAAIERQLLLANDLPGLLLRATLEASPSEPGGSVMRVHTQRSARVASFSLDNRNSPYLGSAGASLALAWQALGERADRLALNAHLSLPAKRSQSLGLNYDALLSAQGTTLGLSASLAKTRPGRELAALDVRSQVLSSQLTLSHPLIRSRQQNLRLVGQLELRDVDTDIAGAAFTRDRLRIARLGLSHDRSDEWDGITALRSMLHLGLDGLGASPRGGERASRANGRSDFVKLTADATRLQQLGPRNSLLATLTGQWSPHALLASEAMSLGGANFGRAYDDGEIAAENGLAAALEIRHNPPDERLPALLAGAQLYAAVDVGKLRAHRDGAALTQAHSLASLSLGLRAQPLPRMSATLDIAKPLTAEVRTQGNRRPRVFLSLNFQL